MKERGGGGRWQSRIQIFRSWALGGREEEVLEALDFWKTEFLGHEGMQRGSGNLARAQRPVDESQVDSWALGTTREWPLRQRAVQVGYICSRDQYVIQTRVFPPSTLPPSSLQRI